MAETIRYSQVYLEDLDLGTGTREVTLADGRVVALAQINNSNLGGAFINVKSAPYKAKGDGVTDDTGAIQAAINDLPSRGSNYVATLGSPFTSGNTLFFPPGVYKVSASLTINLAQNSITFMGAGPLSSAIIGTAALVNLPVILVRSARDFTISAMYVDGVSGSAAECALESRQDNTFQNGTQLRVDRCYLSNNYGKYGIKWTYSGTDQNNENGVVFNSVVRGTTAALSVGHINTMTHRIIGCTLAGAKIAELDSGSLKFIGCELAATGTEFTIASGWSTSSGDDALVVSDCYSECAGAVLSYTGSNAVQVIFTNYRRTGGTASQTAIDFRGAGSFKAVGCNFNYGQSGVVHSFQGGTGQTIHFTDCTDGSAELKWNGHLFIVGGVGSGSHTRTPGGSATIFEVSDGYAGSSTDRFHINGNKGLLVANIAKIPSDFNAEAIYAVYHGWLKTTLSAAPALAGDAIYSSLGAGGLGLTDLIGTNQFWNVHPVTGDMTAWGKLVAGNGSAGVSKYLIGSATWDPGSLIDGAGESKDVTVTGAAVGDYVQASFSQDLQGITISAAVKSANTVTVRLQNETTNTIDLASGTVRALVTQAS